MSIPFHLGTKLEYRTGLQPVKLVLQTSDSSLCLTVLGAADGLRTRKLHVLSVDDMPVLYCRKS
jgi:hypothetical protein